MQARILKTINAYRTPSQNVIENLEFVEFLKLKLGNFRNFALVG